MFRWFIFGYLILEILFVVAFVSSQGILALFGEIFLSGILGFWLIFSGGGITTKEFSRITPNILKTSFGVVLGGFLVLLPGILSDIAGCLLLAVAILVRIFDKNKKQKTEKREKTKFEDDIIDVEIVSEERR